MLFADLLSLHLVTFLMFSYSCIRIYNRDLPQSFQVPRLIDNKIHTLVL